MSYRIRPDGFDQATRSMAAVAAQWDRRLRRIKAIAEQIEHETQPQPRTRQPSNELTWQ